MRRIWFIPVLVAVAAVLLEACSDIGKTCDAYADKISEAVEKGDIKGIAEVDSLFRVDLVTDSVHSALWRKSLADKADGYKNDTVAIAIRVVAEEPQKLGAEMVGELIGKMQDSPKEVFLKNLGITRQMYYAVGRSDDFLTFNSAYQQGIDKLPVGKQMQIYSSIASPRILGEVLADDVIKAQGTPHADSTVVVVNQRLQELKKIYSGSDYEDMKTAFGRLILSTDAASIISSFDL